MEVGPEMSGRIRIPSRQVGCPQPLHCPASVNPADTALSACLLYTPGVAPSTLCLCFSLLAPRDNWITDEGSSQKASGRYADASRLAPEPGWPLLHPLSLKIQEGSELYETCKRFQREKTGKACRRRWTVQSSSFKQALMGWNLLETLLNENQYKPPPHLPDAFSWHEGEIYQG